MNVKRITNRWWDFPAALCLFCAVMASATRLTSTVWTVHLGRVQAAAFIGILLGFAIGYSRFSPRVARWLGFLYGIIAVPWLLVTLTPRGVPWSERVVSLAGRLYISGRQFIRYEAVDDPILFLTLMSILFFLLSISAGYYLVRYGNVWASLIPSGISIFIINHYDPANPAWGRIMGFFLFFSLLLVARVAFMRYRQEWQATGVSQSPEASSDLSRAGLVAVIVLVILAWNVPAFAAASDGIRELWVSISHPWETMRSRFSDALAALRSTAGTVSDFYGDDLKLGTGTRLGDDLVFTVDASVPVPPGARYYWRARSYDRYTDGLWGTSQFRNADVSPEEEGINIPTWLGRQEVEFVFHSQISLLRTFYTGPLPVWVSRPGQAVMDITNEGTLDISTLIATPPLQAGESYQVRSMVSVPTAAQLRSSSIAYPDWVTDRYLQTPANLPNRLRDLAHEITRGSDNPYDKTVAITQYLRDTITYSDSIPNPPAGVDPLEWFLFTQKSGFCNYYASAEIMLLRSLGIPARLAVGFAQGEQGEDGTTFTVRHRDAHAWPEVYFEGFGWVEFEPTVSQPTRDLLAGLQPDPVPNILPDRLQDFLDEVPERFNREEAGQGAGGFLGINPATIPAGWLWLATSAIVIGLVLGGWYFARTRFQLPAFPVFLELSMERGGFEIPGWLRTWSRRAKFSVIEKAYNLMNLALRFLDKPAAASQTPAERAEHLSQVLPESSQPAHSLVNEYETEIYSHKPANPDTARQAGSRIQSLSIRAIVARLFGRSPSPPKKVSRRS
jgi:transglutaminase-like putative cysteine protease